MTQFLTEKIFGVQIQTWLIISSAVVVVTVMLGAIFHKKSRELLHKHKEIILYLVFGILTTIVNYTVYFPLANIPKLSEESFRIPVVNIIAWIVSVAFAFIVNKKFVFESEVTAAKSLFREILSFVGSRIISFLIEEGLLILVIRAIGISQNDTKVIVSIVVVILNYIFSKFFVFKKGKG